MTKRPLSLTIIGWFLIITSLLSIYSLVTMGSDRKSTRLNSSHTSKPRMPSSA